MTPTRTDVNFASYSDVNDLILPDKAVYDPALEGKDRLAFDDILKFSNCHRLRAYGVTAIGGRENPLDMNRTCRDIILTNPTLVGGNHCALVIKGGTVGVILSGLMIREVSSTWTDIELGGWSDQSMDVTRDIHLINARREDGKPIRVILGRAEKPFISGGSVAIDWQRSLALKLFWWSKFASRRLLQLAGR